MLKEVIKKEMITAMKNKDKKRKEILSMIISEIERAEMKKKSDLVNKERKAEAKRLNIDADKVELTAEKIEEINKEAMFSEVEEIKIVEKLLKSSIENLKMLEGKENRKTDIENTKLEISIYEQFIPKQMSEDEIKEVINSVLIKLDLVGKATMANKGIIMKELMPLTKGKADGKIVNTIVTNILS